MHNKPSSDVLLGELVSVLAEFAGLLCVPTVEDHEDGHVTLTVRIAPREQATIGGAVETLELLLRLQRVIDVGTMRALAARYDIAPDQLEKLLPPGDTNA